MLTTDLEPPCLQPWALSMDLQSGQPTTFPVAPPCQVYSKQNYKVRGGGGGGGGHRVGLRGRLLWHFRSS